MLYLRSRSLKQRSMFFVSQEHILFWQPVIDAVVKAILADCQTNNRPIIFASRQNWFHKNNCIAIVCFTDFTVRVAPRNSMKQIACLTARMELFPKMLCVKIALLQLYNGI